MTVSFSLTLLATCCCELLGNCDSVLSVRDIIQRLLTGLRVGDFDKNYWDKIRSCQKQDCEIQTPLSMT